MKKLLLFICFICFISACSPQLVGEWALSKGNNGLWVCHKKINAAGATEIGCVSTDYEHCLKQCEERWGEER